MIGDQIHKAPGHRDIGYVGRPDLVRTVDHQTPQQVRIHLVRLIGLSSDCASDTAPPGPWSASGAATLAIDPMPLVLQPVPIAPTTVVGMHQVAADRSAPSVPDPRPLTGSGT